MTFPGSAGPLRWMNPGGLPQLAGWLRKTIADLVGDRGFAILGDSLGGLLAGHMASVFGSQVLGLALFAPVVHPRPRDRKLPPRSILHHDQDFLESLDPADAREFEQVAVHQSAEAWAVFRDVALPGIRSADAHAVSRLARRYQLDIDAGQHLPPLMFPTLIVTGRQDHVVGFEDQLGLLQRYQHATYAVLDGAGHNIHLDQPGPVGALLRDWSLRAQAVAS